ncbi:MAG: hypothetical protein PHE50_00575 [Dehalococcoidales bacterium]|nr:hypothetical protein [Dehalococcoidales bacterium]
MSQLDLMWIVTLALLLINFFTKSIAIALCIMFLTIGIGLTPGLNNFMIIGVVCLFVGSVFSVFKLYEKAVKF